MTHEEDRPLPSGRTANQTDLEHAVLVRLVLLIDAADRRGQAVLLQLGTVFCSLLLPCHGDHGHTFCVRLSGDCMRFAALDSLDDGADDHNAVRKRVHVVVMKQH